MDVISLTAELAKLRAELDRAYANTMRTREEREEMSAMLDKRSSNHSHLEATVQQLKVGSSSDTFHSFFFLDFIA